MEAKGNVNRNRVLHVTEARLKTLREDTPSQVLYMPHDEEHDKRQAFRKRVDYILGANKPAQAIESLKWQVVLELAHRILRDPEEKRVRRIKISNPRVQRTILVPKGVCELVVEREDYSSCYVYSAKTYNTLRIGSAIIEEILEREVKKQEFEVQRQQREEEEQKELIEKLHNQFLDDRKSVAVRVQRERQSGVQEKGIPRRKGAPLKSDIATIHGIQT
uniref:PUB domain-containing protein n=1 Tax=Ganoderma boninense TaxID=34458 RepID=A0A5K1JY09_9APHY|nr:Uncharacterized protein [Ganoderma boninense]